MKAAIYMGKESIVGSGGYFPEDVRDVMAIMKSGRWELERIITHEFSIDEIARAIQTAADADHAILGFYSITFAKNLDV